MKVLFIHDGPLYRDKNGNIYGIDYNTKLKNRYLELGDTVSFLMRINDLEKIGNKKVSAIEESNFKAIDVPDFKSPRMYKKNRIIADRIIKQAVLEHDILVIRLPSFIGNIALKYAKKYNKKYIIEMVACAWDGYKNHSVIGGIIAPYMWYKTRSIVKKSKYCIYVSQSFLQKRYPCNGKTIGVSDVILPPKNNEVIRGRLNRIDNLFLDRKIVIGTAGAVNMKYKGHRYVIHAISLLNKKGYNIEYQIVGGGDKSKLEYLAEKYSVSDLVKFMGPKPHNEVLEWMDNIDIYIQPSLAEAHGRVLIEAMSRGCTCIGSNVGGIPELINREYIFKKKKVNEICRIIENIDKDILIQEANYSFEKSKAFNIENLDQIRREFYKEFLEEVESD